MSWTPDLLAGIAAHLAAGSSCTWKPDTPYTPGEVGIVLAYKPATPDRVVVVTPYPVDIGHGGADVTEAIQVRYRGTTDPTTVFTVRDEIRAVLDGLGAAGAVQLGGVWVANAWLQSGTKVSFDANQRAEAFDNFYLQAERPTALRHDN